MSKGFCTAYTASPQLVKLSELRARTDQQLLKLIHSKAKLGISLLALVEFPYPDGNPDHSEQLLKRAEQAVIEVKRLLPVLSEDQRRGFGPMLKSLQDALDRLDRNRERPRSKTASMY